MDWCVFLHVNHTLVIDRVVLMEGADIPGCRHNCGLGYMGISLGCLHVRGLRAVVGSHGHDAAHLTYFELTH